MPYNGAGTFTPVYNWATDKANGIKIRADRMDGQDSDISTGLTDCVTRDGQSPATANLPMGTFKHTGVGLASNATDYLRADQAQSNSLTFFVTSAGTSDAYALTPSPAVSALSKGLSFYIRIHNTNTTTTPTLAVSGLAAATISNGDLSALGVGDLVLDSVVLATYQGTAGFVLPNRTASAIWGLTDGGFKAADFQIAANTRYVVYPPTAGCTGVFPNSSAAAGKFAMFVKIGTYPFYFAGTVNGIAGTVIGIQQQQTLITGCTTINGWV